MTQVALQIFAGERTEELLQVLLAEVDDETLDGMKVSREISKTEGLAAEPLTLSVVLLASPVVLSRLLDVIDDYLKDKNRIEQGRLIVDAHREDPELAKLLAGMMKRAPRGWSLRFGKWELRLDKPN